MQVKACKNCRKLFNYLFGPELCPVCIAALPKEISDELSENCSKSEERLSATLDPHIVEEEELFQTVSHYVVAHPKATILQISIDNKVKPAKILNWIREERMAFSDECRDAWFDCEACGTKIKSGRLCNSCKRKY